jgi:hypothetical protein
MSVILPLDPQDALGHPSLGPVDVCWYCGQPLGPEPVVLWRGTDGLLTLHGHCARALGAHLVADSREAELASGRPPWTRRVARAAGAALRAHEVLP